MSEVRAQSWTRDEVRRLLNVSERQLLSWEKQKLVSAAESYGFHDLVSLRTLVNLRKLKIPPMRIKKTLAALRGKLQDVRNPLTELKVFTDGRRIGVQVDGRKMEPITGQLLLDFDAVEIRKMLAFPRKRENEAEKRAESERWFQRGLDLERENAEFQEIVAAYEKAIELNPGCSGALVNLGTIFYHARKWKEAERNYVRAIEVDPEYALAHFNLGNLYDETGDGASALFHYQAALSLNPSYSDAHYNLALLFQSRGEYMKAVGHWKAYLKLDPTSSWAEIAKRELHKLTAATVVQGGQSR